MQRTGTSGFQAREDVRKRQCRAARALLDWSQSDLAEAAHVSLSTIADFERGHRLLHTNTLHAIRTSIEHAGIVFADDDSEGVARRNGT